MPVIPDYVAPIPGEIPASNARYSPSALAAPGLALERSGEGTEKLANELARLAEFHDTEYFNDQLADATTKAHDRLGADQQRVLLQAAGNALGLASIRGRLGGDAGGLARDFDARVYDPYLDAAHLEQAAGLVSGARSNAVGNEEAGRMLAGAGPGGGG